MERSGTRKDFFPIFADSRQTKFRRNSRIVPQHDGISTGPVSRSDPMLQAFRQENQRRNKNIYHPKNPNTMQNKLFTLLCTGLLAFALTSCDKDESSDSTKLAAPVLNVTEQTSNGFTVSWQTVENTAGYAIMYSKKRLKRAPTPLRLPSPIWSRVPIPSK